MWGINKDTGVYTRASLRVVAQRIFNKIYIRPVLITLRYGRNRKKREAMEDMMKTTPKKIWKSIDIITSRTDEYIPSDTPHDTPHDTNLTLHLAIRLSNR